MARFEPLSVVYLLDDTVLFGGVKVVLQQADLLAARGHRVEVVARGPRPSWYELRASFHQVEHFNRNTVPAADIVVATYWTTINPALAVSAGEVVHYCQGYEAGYTHNTADHANIVEAYGANLPAMVVSEHLGNLLAREFARPSRVVLQPLETFWKPGLFGRFKRSPGKPVNILVPGPWEGDWKGVPTGLRTVAELRRRDFEVRLVRLSQYPLKDEERSVLAPDEYHEHVPPVEVARIVKSCDLVLAPSWEQEGFGLPVLEAFAAGVPVIASDISCFRAFAAEAAALAPVDDANAFADRAAEILRDPKRWRRHRHLGFAVAARFTPELAAQSAEDALRWVASGAWRNEIRS